MHYWMFSWFEYNIILVKICRTKAAVNVDIAQDNLTLPTPDVRSSSLETCTTLKEIVDQVNVQQI